MSRVDEVDDYTFLNHPQQGSSGYLLGSDDSSSNQAWLERRQQLLEERRKIEERTLESSKMSLGALYEAESTGIETAQALVHQREQLENTERNLDTINNMMRQSQKHLNAMKSIFGGFKSMFSKNNDQANKPTPILPVENRTKSVLASNLENIQREATQSSAKNHPALANRGLDTSGFRFDDSDGPMSPTSPKGHSANRSQVIEQQLDRNLDEMGLGLSRLKNLAAGLSQEIDEHNDMLPRIMMKAERAEDTLQYQNRQINLQLRK
ncbi:synaptosomal-associated protein 29 [Tetranychus urticae]|uniref:t-SNARE coiled-coil homology domain-containing protein n=1 Tax=Tetranychus urticae TaxID=32264 RepID=T1L1D4_TETUR|nr:synaptosomal-associated protein 29 [Tetranychus urticae]